MRTSESIATTLSFSSMFFLGVGLTVLGAAARNIGLSAYEIGVLQTVQNLGLLVSIVVFGTLADSVRRPTLLLAGSIALSFGFFLFYVSPSLLFNAGMMVLIGVGMGSYEGVTDPMLLDIHTRRPSFFINLNHFFVTTGGIAVTAYVLFLQFDWRRATIQASVVVFAIAIAYSLLRLPRTTKGSASGLTTKLQILRTEPTILILFLAMTATLGFQIGTAGVLTTFLMDYREFSQITSKVALIVFNLGVAAGRLLVGFTTPRHHLYRNIVVLFGLTTVISVLLYGVDVGPATYLVVFLSGFAVSSLLPLITTMGGLVYPEMSGTALGVIKMGIPAGGILVPFLISVAVPVFGARCAFFVFPVVSACAFLMVIFAESSVRKP